MISIEQIAQDPLQPSVYSEGPMHPLREVPNGLLFKPSDFPLYLGLIIAPLIAIAWYATRNLNIDEGLKLAAWLFPLFASIGPLVGWAVMQVLATRFFFNSASR